ncbi:metallophosphoesterase [Haloferula sp. BvORR071]|uniref:metallophosphoesterase n=1 Tax=Haloferula sp. BvORR071 TaxID=1396141 RepID=UPI0006969D26|nr:metallophosphoesterase [Haloferula sp. BvORR071]
MDRRTSLKSLAAGTLAGVIPPSLLAQAPAEAPAVEPHAEKIPEIPFDAPKGSWTLAVFPDSQSLTRLHPEVFIRQAEWVAAHKESHDIRFVAHLGDITDNNLPYQWTNAKAAMDVIKKAGIPYSLLPGNHDLGANGGTADRSTLMNDFFKPADYSNSQSVVYFEPGHLENSAHGFNTPHGDFLILALEFAPRNAVVAWANEQASAHPHHTVIMTTHAYMFSDDTRYDLAKFGSKQTWNPKTYPLAKNEEVNDGEDLWQKLVSQHANIRFTLNGHVLNDGAARTVSPGKGGQNVHQILSNYQYGVKPDRPFHGGGYFRLMQFLADKKTVRVKTYSPWLDKWMDGPEQQFEVVV